MLFLCVSVSVADARVFGLWQLLGAKGKRFAKKRYTEKAQMKKTYILVCCYVMFVYCLSCIFYTKVGDVS